MVAVYVHLTFCACSTHQCAGYVLSVMQQERSW